MQKLILLIAIILASLTASSQIVTKSTTDSVITLPKNVAKEVVKDIMRNDSLEAELKTSNANQVLLKVSLSASDSIIKSKDDIIKLWVLKENNYLTIIDLKDQQKANLESLNKIIAADLRKAKRKSTVKSIVSTAIIGALTYLYIVK